MEGSNIATDIKQADKESIPRLPVKITTNSILWTRASSDDTSLLKEHILNNKMQSFHNQDNYQITRPPTEITSHDMFAALISHFLDIIKLLKTNETNTALNIHCLQPSESTITALHTLHSSLTYGFECVLVFFFFGHLLELHIILAVLLLLCFWRL
jgi:hypothetical protein